MSPHPLVALRGLLLATTTAVVGVAAVASLTPVGGTALPATSAEVTSYGAAAAVAPVPLATRLPDVAAILDAQRAAGLDCDTTATGLPVCVHGDHEPPAGAQPSYATAASDGAATTAAGGGAIGCYGDGQSGPRVRLVYARPQATRDQYAATLGSFRRWAAAMSGQVDASAARTKGRRHVRFATTAGGSCTLLVQHVVLPREAFGTFRATIDALQAAGLDQPRSKYLVWADTTGYCGMSTSYADDRPGLDNANNGPLPGYARIDRRCWGRAETHELVHLLGGVQPSARNATAGFHCNDGADVMCYDDGTASSRQRSVCPAEQVHLLDCRSDDYFSTAAPRGSYLQTHWNVARSSFLAPTLTDARQPSAPASPSPAPSPSRAPSPAASPPGAVPPAGGLLPTLPPLPTLAPLPSLLGGAR